MNFLSVDREPKKKKWDGPGTLTGDQRFTEEKGKDYFFQWIVLGHLLD
jgi:hypothetical protein